MKTKTIQRAAVVSAAIALLSANIFWAKITAQSQPSARAEKAVFEQKAVEMVIEFSNALPVALPKNP